MIDKTDSEEFGLGFGFIEEDFEAKDCTCCEPLDVEGKLPPLKVTPPRLEVEIEFADRDDIKAGGLYTDAIDAIYIEDDEIRLVDGPIAQVISLDDIHFLRANIR